MKPVHYFFLGTGSWYFSHGIQTVIFAWLVTIVLRESPEMVGIALMTSLLPAMLLMLIGGSLGDQFGGKPVAIVGQSLAALCVFTLTIVIYLDRFNYSVLLTFAFVMGCALAIVTPARDGLLTSVAEGRIQRTVVLATMAQFGIQLLGFLVASFADSIGAVVVLSIQCAALIFGIVALYKMEIPALQATAREQRLVKHLLISVNAGMQTVRQSPAMLMVVVMNCAMGLFFMASYFVTVPLLVREVYGGTSVQLAWINIANGMGLILMILYLLRMGDIRRPGRALLIAHMIGALALASAALGIGFAALIISVGVWGLAGGVAVTMTRTIMLELAPADQRSRIMAFYSFSFMGAGPVGALLSGYMSQWLGPAAALLLSATAMMIAVITVANRSALWQLELQSPARAGNA